MPGLLAVFRKELADHLGSKRLLILFAVIVLAALFATYVARQSIAAEVRLGASGNIPFPFLRLFTTSNDVLPPLVSFLIFFGPLMGLILAFDAINREQSSGTLSLVLAQPLFRDSVINGKFLAGVATISIMLLSIVLMVSGFGLYMLGIPPTSEEILRIIAYLVMSIIYISFWMALALLFSIFFIRITTSALAAVGVWLFFILFISMIAGIVADQVAPVMLNPRTNEDLRLREAQQIRHDRVQQAIVRVSPVALYDEATFPIMIPSARSLAPVSTREQASMLPGPLPLRQSLIVAWPQLTSLIALTLVCFAISYVRFMRQEIRAP